LQNKRQLMRAIAISFWRGCGISIYQCTLTSICLTVLYARVMQDSDNITLFSMFLLRAVHCSVIADGNLNNASHAQIIAKLSAHNNILT